MVAHFTMRTNGVNQAFRFVEGIWLHWKSHKLRLFFRKKTLFTSYVRNVKWATIYYKNHGFFAVSNFCLLLTGCISVFLYNCAVYGQFLFNSGLMGELNCFVPNRPLKPELGSLSYFWRQILILYIPSWLLRYYRLLVSD